ncbi:YhcB family protein [Aestuariibacter sp. AA17]|uniref:YhcB family protein n=1 Tax=Fluctibacter corallii TaxID=2984329 RepID=A0ABT3A519_9ALTE|nr:YhcB family protein [Aestuariibacter sp. AA17]MCV2883644.1 YhcB family protein [Aestuariibacter sp. AA17]
MDWIVGILLLLAGVIVGFFIAKYVYANQNKKASKDTANTLKQVLAQQAASHINQSRMIVDTLKLECEKLEEEINGYETLLQSETKNEGGAKLNYFGEHATTIIGNQQKREKRAASATDVQPRDFSMGGSGLFDGSVNEQVVDKQK